MVDRMHGTREDLLSSFQRDRAFREDEEAAEEDQRNKEIEGPS